MVVSVLLAYLATASALQAPARRRRLATSLAVNTLPEAPHAVSIDLGDGHEPLVLETGRLGRQADAAVIAKRGGTTVYTTLCVGVAQMLSGVARVWQQQDKEAARAKARDDAAKRREPAAAAAPRDDDDDDDDESDSDSDDDDDERRRRQRRARRAPRPAAIARDDAAADAVPVPDDAASTARV